MWLPGAVHLSYIETEAQNQQSASVLPLFWSASLMAWHVETVCGPGQVDELSAKYQAVSIEEVEEGWKDVYERSLTSCMHGAACQQGPSCQVSMPASDLCPSESTPERPAHYKSVHLSDQQTWHQTYILAEFCLSLLPMYSSIRLSTQQIHGWSVHGIGPICNVASTTCECDVYTVVKIAWFAMF